MKKMLKTYSEIEVWLDHVMELLNGLEEKKDAKILEQIKEKYHGLITDWMEEQNQSKIKFYHDLNIGIEYMNFGNTNEK